MNISVILSTYDAPEWLEKVLWGYTVQSHRDFEIVVADDGSTGETARLLVRLRRETRLEICHVWHEHRGFRKCTILNRAIVEARSDYLVFTDGDCIPHRDFLALHAALAKPGTMLSGGCVRLPMAVSRKITPQDVVAGRATSARWLWTQGMPLAWSLRMLACGPTLRTLLDAATTTRATLNGCNSSAWADDVLRVNGFDERMEYGGLDRELGERLVNAGVRPRQIRHRAVCVHLDHARGYKQAGALARNLAIRRETRRTGSTWTPYGIYQESQQLPLRRAA